MIIRYFLIIQTIIYISNNEIPESSCSTINPFYKSEHSCGDFNDVCVKRECHNFQAAYSQCPPSNLTVSVLQHLKNLSTVFLEAFILCAIIILVLLFFDKSKSIDEKFERIIHENNETLLKEIKEVKEKHETFERVIHENNETFLKEIKEVKEKHYETLLNEIKQDAKEKDEKYQTHINEEYSTLYSVVRHKLRFQIANQFDETELIVSKFDNVIKLKKSICDRNMNMYNYKRMIMKYKGVTLDNNQYLLSCIDSTNIPIFCEFDNNVDVNAMIVIKLKCDNIYPEMLQIWKHQQIKDLKIIISKLNNTNHDDLLIFYKSTQLNDDDKTIDYYKIEDNDWIQIVNKSEEMKNITMKSIFTDNETISIEFSKFETVSDIIDRSIQKIQPKIATNYYFVVFLNKKVMQNDKFIYEYNIDRKSLVEFCYFKNVNEINELVIPDDYDHIKMGEAKNKITKRPVLIKAYKREYMDIENDNDLSRVLREDLQIFQLTKFHPRFIQLFDIYLDNDLVYIELEDLRKGLMKKFLSNKKEKGNEISIYDISKWAYQILEGLKYLHNHNIILKDMNPMNIWIDENFDIKLTSFNTTEYLNHLNDENKNKYIYGVDQYKPNILTYVAPEILESKPHKSIFHMWSFGVIRNDMIIVSLIIKYDKTKKPKYLTDFIDCCVKRDPKERAKINDLEDLRKGLMKKFLSNNKKKKKGNEISIYDIYQNLEGLKYLHDHNIIMKDMNPMDIWIDGNNDVKLPSFNIIEYLNHLEGDQVIKYMHKPGILTYVAPEILENKPYEASVDVWSLGVIMIEIMTVDELYSELSNDQVVQKIKESHTIKYDKTNTPADLIDFINFCVKGDPKEKDRDPQ